MHSFLDAGRDGSISFVAAEGPLSGKSHSQDHRPEKLGLQTVQSGGINQYHESYWDPAGENVGHIAGVTATQEFASATRAKRVLSRSSCLPSAETSPPASTAAMPEPHGPANTTPPPLAPAPQRLRIRRRSTRQKTVRLLAELEGLLHPAQVLQTNSAAAAFASRFRGGGGRPVESQLARRDAAGVWGGRGRATRCWRRRRTWCGRRRGDCPPARSPAGVRLRQRPPST